MRFTNTNKIGEYEGAVEFIEKEKSWKEFKELFNEDDIKHIVESKEDEKQKIYALFEHLNSLGWSDEDIIGKFLNRDEKVFDLRYIDDKNNGYFEIWEVFE